MLRTALFFALGLFLFPLFTFAQTADEITVNILPERPKPHQEVRVSLSSLTLNIPGSTITWRQDGEIKLSGIGRTEYSFTTGEAGKVSTLAITVAAPGGIPVTRQVTINPAGIDVLWEAIDSIVPPLYKGKALASSESRVKFVAMPEIRKTNGSFFAQDELIYNWERNYDASPTDSGYAKNSFTIKTSVLDAQENVAVEATPRSGGLGALARFSLATTNPKILWYELSPLYGPIFTKALSDSYTVQGSELSVLAMPYFFSPKNPSSTDLEYRWTLNDSSVNPVGTKNILVLHRNTENKGEAVLELSITNIPRLFQEARGQLTLYLQ